MTDQKASVETGELSVDTRNLFPLLKKWLYSDKDIFLRELIANAHDAIRKLERIASAGDYSGPIDPSISIRIDKEARTLTVSDTGLGMTREETVRYIANIAFSGLTDFIERYHGKNERDQIIGFFGVGFYSAFMVADEVEVVTRSYQEGAAPVRWRCKGTPAYTVEGAERDAVGTDVILHLSEGETEYLDEYVVERIVRTHCQFLPVPIKVNGRQVNDTDPLWCKEPGKVTDDEYRAFYRKLYNVWEDPLFWIHLNVDYPFVLKGILYFPPLRRELERPQHPIRIYCNRMFVTDHSSELVPEFLTLLQGVIDSKDVPLNISRSMLQQDPTVKKIGALIVRKVADRLVKMRSTEPDRYAEVWERIHPIIKYGCMRDEAFFERVEGALLFETTAPPPAGRYTTLADYLSRNAGTLDKTVLYAADADRQSAYIEMLRKRGMEALILDSVIDVPFIQFLEAKRPGTTFTRVDSDIDRLLRPAGEEGGGSTSEEDRKRIADLFKECIGDEAVPVRVESLAEDALPAVLVVGEHLRRIEDIDRVSPMGPKPFQAKASLVVNDKSPVIRNLLALIKGRRKDRRGRAETLCRTIYDLALLAQGKLDGSALSAFVERQQEILARYAS